MELCCKVLNSPVQFYAIHIGAIVIDVLMHSDIQFFLQLPRYMCYSSTLLDYE